jgi:phosphoenolpyruvate carboxylase
MLKHATPPTADTLDEYKLRDELRALRAKIPDRPAMNPIINVAFDLSRDLESGRISFEELKALAGRLMDRACVRRARALRERTGYTDHSATIAEFSNFVDETAASYTPIQPGVSSGRADSRFANP